MSTATRSRTDAATRRRRLGEVLSGVVVAVGCVLFLGGFVWGALVYQPYTVPTNSMAPTIDVGDRVLAQRLDGAEVRRGDVVVFQDEGWGGVPMLKRVVGVGGDHVACCDAQGRLTVNGRSVAEPYVEDAQTPGQRFAVTVPRGRLFLLGDRRAESLDSRARLSEAGHGAVPREAVVARVDARVWPLDGLAMVARPAGFAELPGGVSEPGPLVSILVVTAAGAVLIFGGAAYGPVARRLGRVRGR